MDEKELNSIKERMELNQVTERSGVTLNRSMNTMKNDPASARKLSEGEERLLCELGAVREERNKTVEALLEACKDAYAELNQLAFLHGDKLASVTLNKLQQAIKKAEG